ncbi:MAG TPA: DUF3570 domain-containing protein, partial [Candidatus Eisenbacteria bacterium]|nr:DUF3570 domain-containing protein [Candidatus Eisenbacteria bacterium]
LLAASGPAARAHADGEPADSSVAPAPPPASASVPPPAASAHWQFESSALLYGERTRTNVIEPIGRITRLMANGQTLSAGLTLDAITGASPTGALPTGRVPATVGGGDEGVQGGVRPVQTVTAASGGGGGGSTPKPGDIPVNSFSDFRGALTLDWVRPIGSLLTVNAGTHFSREKDYQSTGISGKLSLDMMQRLTTLTVGGATDHDDVFPTRGTPAGLDSLAPKTGGWNPKRVNGGLVGLSRILTRRWMVSVNGSRTFERGYLTEPYKVVSIVGADGYPIGQLPEKRPTERIRSDILAGSVYHLARDVLYTSYRYYWDDWKLTSHTVDVMVRHDLDEQTFIQPHVRFYTQSAASFFRYGFTQAELDANGLPAYASADDRLGVLHDVTVGATYGFHTESFPGEFTIRAEYIRQWGSGHPPQAVGVQRGFNLAPGIDIGAVTAGYSVSF